jgi:hypothetical protein
MQQGQTPEFGRRRHDEIYGSGAAVLPSLGQCFLDLPRSIESAVVHRHPSKQQRCGGAHQCSGTDRPPATRC